MPVIQTNSPRDPVRGCRLLSVFGLAVRAAVVIGISLATLGAPQTAAAAGSTSFSLVSGGKAAAIIYSPSDFKVVGLAATDFAADVESVTSVKPVLQTNLSGVSGPAVFVGTVGHSKLIDNLVAARKLDVAALRGQWESFLVTVVTNPQPGVAQALVVAGSDRRGTAFGIYELSQRIGVSPWHWWADVTPEKRGEILLPIEALRMGPPSVQYRGIFLNDEDWGLQPWAAKTFDPATGDIGPKTYRKIFELLLRLRANTLWPAMHHCTKPFNSFPENAQLADDYAIVMGSSHAEPMLRNNVGEWTAPPEDFNYAKNRDGVRAYWEQRLRENGRFENFYTVGMRGIHDSAMQGPKNRTERIELLEQIFTDQRALLAQYLNPKVEQVPQLFCAYKEVLDLYRGGLRVPDDVTVMFPDDNFGYIRDFPSPAERQRAGGFGIYYHISYLGRPLSDLWLNTTPPALIWEEMSKAYDLGARKIWILNVGDLKPGEIGMEFFLQMAWDIHRWRADNLPDFLTGWATREFGTAHATEIAALMNEYYALNFQRKPEHLQWWLSGQPQRPSALNAAEVRERLDAFAKMALEAERLQALLPETKRDAFFELVAYPVRGSALANERFFCAEESNSQPTNSPAAAIAAARAISADAQLKELTRDFNEHIAVGKWNHILTLEPADKQWGSMRIAPFLPPKSAAGKLEQVSGTNFQNLFILAKNPGLAHNAGEFVETNGVVSIEAEHFSGKADRADARWEVIPGLGRTGDAVAMFPATVSGVEITSLAASAPRLDYTVTFTSAGEFPMTVYLLPTHPITGRALRFAIGLDDAPPQLVELNLKDGSADWAQGVLNATVTAIARLKVPAPGPHSLHLYGVDAGVAVDKLVVDCGGLKPSYLGPPETPTIRR